MRPLRIAALVILVLAAVALAGVGRPGALRGAEPAVPAAQRSITVAGSAAVVAVPDQATFSFGVDARGESASHALSAASSAARNVVDAVKRLGVDAGDVRTEQISLSPLTSDDGRHIDGYAASASVSVLARSLDRAGPLVDAAVAAGADTVYGPSLDRSDASELSRRALSGAVADARTKAEALAKAAGGSLGRVVSMTETGGMSPPVPYAREAALASGVPIEPGTQEIQASVTVTFELR